jgi:glutaredoxin 3
VAGEKLSTPARRPAESVVRESENAIGRLPQSASQLRRACVTLGENKKGDRKGVGLVMYVKPGCPYCQQARDYYNSKGIAFTEYDAQNDRARRKEMFAYSDNDPTVPCIVEDGRYVQSGWGDPPRG